MTIRMQKISTRLGRLDAAIKARVASGAWSSDEIDAIVVGSGYGGAIAAARLAEAGHRVCLLERGREILPGDYPRDLRSAFEEIQVTTARDGRLVPGGAGGGQGRVPNGLLDLRINDDMNVIVGCGLGGTSLINANVSLKTDPRTFWRTSPDGDYFWPSEFRRKDKAGIVDVLAEYYDRAREMLGAIPLPDGYHPNKLKALKVSADALGQPIERPEINVTFKDGKNAAGVFQTACRMCGDCCSGCNYGSKNTTLMNYLPLAHSFSAVLVTEAQVTHLTPPTDAGGIWTVHLEDLSPQAAPDGIAQLQARTVILGAGTLGSTEILLRSRETLKQAGRTAPFLSDRLGERFSGNGDVLGFGFDASWDPQARAAGKARPPIWGIGAGENFPLPAAHPGEESALRPGPCITGVIKVGMAEGDPIERAAVIEEGVAPGALALAYPALFLMQEALHGQLTRFPDTGRRLEDAQALGASMLSAEGQAAVSYGGAMSRTQSFLLMSHDSSGGRIEWNAATKAVKVVWKGVGTEAPYKRDNALLKHSADAIWANYLPSPLWHSAFGHRLVTVHPVGGCAMGEDATKGVVNHDCRVFTGNGATEVYDGLLVCDGAVMPTSLGLNPLLTISAVAERAMERLIARLGRKPVAFPQPPAPYDPGPVLRAQDGWNYFVGELARAKKWLLKLRARIAADAWDDAATQVYDFLVEINTRLDLGYDRIEQDIYWYYLRFSNELPDDINPAIDEVLAVLDRVLTAAGRHPGSYGALVKILKEDLGDFSPNLKFHETMTGFASRPGQDGTGVLSDLYEIAARRGEAQGETLSAEFAVSAGSIGALTAKPAHRADLGGTVAWRGQTYDIGAGQFELLTADTARVDTFQMIYTGGLTPRGAAGDAKPLWFRGVKTLRRRAGSNWWDDLTTLRVDIEDGRGNALCRGIITLRLQDFVAQMTTLVSEFDQPLASYDGRGVFGKLAVDTLPDLPSFEITHGHLHDDLKDPEIRRQIILKIVAMALAAPAKTGERSEDAEKARTAALFAMRYYQMEFAAFFAERVFRSYGGLLAYLFNFPARDRTTPLPLLSGGSLRALPQVISEWHPFKSAPEVDLQLIRYDGSALNAGPAKCPVILAPGFGVVAQSYAMETIDTHLVDALCAEGFDVWLFDYRASPALGKTNTRPFNIDQIATQDWPAAVDYVCQATGAPQVQAVVHCVGSLSLLMALLSGKLMPGRVRSIVSSQLTVHPVTNWFNKMKADTKMASWIVKGVPAQMAPVLDSLIGPEAARLFEGLSTIDATSPVHPGEPASPEDQALNLMLWGAPFPNGEPCYSPTCHRIFGIYGPSYLHSNLNQATHDAIQTVFGPIATAPFEHIALMVRMGQAVTASGEDVYLPHPERLRLPIHFIAGALNLEFTPDTTLRTYDWLRSANPDCRDLYSRQVFDGYGHMDCFIGKNAAHDIFPSIVAALKRHPAHG